MNFKIAPEIFRDFPGVTIGIVVAHEIDNTKSPQEVKQLLEQIQEKLRNELTIGDISFNPHLTTWVHAYDKFGARPKKYVPSVISLVQKVLDGKLRSINPLVDIYNYISLKYLLPAGGEDLATMKGNIELCYARADEKPIVLLGESEAHAPKEGEVIYKDANGAICRRWNWKEADRTKLTSETKNALLVLEMLPPVELPLLESATHELADLIEQYCGGLVTVALVSQEHPEVGLKKKNIYQKLQLKKKIQAIDFGIFKRRAPDVPDVHAKTISEEHEHRLEKVSKIREAGREPWPAAQEVNSTCKDVSDEFVEDAISRAYELAGRIVALREHGKTAFAHLQDRSGKLQIYIRQDVVGDEAYSQLKNFIDIGDFIWVRGKSFKTKTGEITLKVESFTLQSKCLHPLPEKFHGIADIEIKYRQRYLDLISSPESRERFAKRSKIIKVMRQFFDAHGYMEVETPMLHPIPGGAAARPFVTHHNALDTQLYLRIAPELYLKRLVVGGFERVYEINRNFRNEGISTRHNPEFTMVEFYTAYKDYHFAMDFVEKMIRDSVMETNNVLQVPFGELTIDFAKPFERLSMKQAVMKYGKIAEKDLSDTTIDATLKNHKIETTNKKASWGEKLLALFEALVESKLLQPTFIIDFPIEISPLAKRDPKNPAIAARFELFMAGMELANGFNELNDPFDQAERFKEQAKARAGGDIEAHYYDADFVLALEYALPPTVGVGIGVDRLTMLLTNTTSIRDVILFPTLKKKEGHD